MCHLPHTKGEKRRFVIGVRFVKDVDFYVAQILCKIHLSFKRVVRRSTILRRALPSGTGQVTQFGVSPAPSPKVEHGVKL